MLADMQDFKGDETRWKAHLLVSRELQELGDIPGAVKHARIATDTVPDSAPDKAAAVAALVSALANQGDYDGIFTALERAARVHKTDPYIRYLLAAQYAMRSDWDKVLEELDMAVSLGFRGASLIESEPVFSPILKNRRVRTLLKRMKKEGPIIRFNTN